MYTNAVKIGNLQALCAATVCLFYRLIARQLLRQLEYAGSHLPSQFKISLSPRILTSFQRNDLDTSQTKLPRSYTRRN